MVIVNIKKNCVNTYIIFVIITNHMRDISRRNMCDISVVVTQVLKNSCVYLSSIAVMYPKSELTERNGKKSTKFKGEDKMIRLLVERNLCIRAKWPVRPELIPV